MCEFGKQTNVLVKIPADLSCNGKEKWKVVGIDSCIAEIVHALQKAGINMRGSCCGHGKIPGDIHLQDGRILIVADAFYLKNQIAWLKNTQRQFELIEGSER